MDSPSSLRIVPNNEGWYEPKGSADKMSSGHGEEQISVLPWLMVASLGLTGHLAATRTSAKLGVFRSPMWKSSIVVRWRPFQISSVGWHPRYSVLAVSGGSCYKEDSTTRFYSTVTRSGSWWSEDDPTWRASEFCSRSGRKCSELWGKPHCDSLQCTPLDLLW